jgi:transcriptional regulator with XRE-family HTH domain
MSVLVKKVHASFGDNVSRILGMHNLSARDASKLLGLSTVALSEWRQGKRSPSLNALLRLSAVFEVAGDRLVTAPFTDLLANELGDVDRFERVEEKIAKANRQLRMVTPDEGIDMPWLVTPEQAAKSRGKPTPSRQKSKQ